MKILSTFANKAEKAVTRSMTETPAIKLEQNADSFIKEKEDVPKQSLMAKNEQAIDKYRTWIDSETIKTLESMSLYAFLREATFFICKRVGIPQGTYPIITKGEMHPIAAMAYSPETNSLIINSAGNALKRSRAVLYSYLRHEIEHQKQSFDILRTEELGEKAIEHYTKKQIQDIKKIITSYKDTPISEIEKQKEELGNYYSIIKNYKLAQQNNTEVEFFEELAQTKEKEFKENYLKLQRKLIEVMGGISKGSKEATVTNKHFEEILDETDIHDIDSIKAGTKQSMEQSAYYAGYIALGEYLLTKLADKLKAFTNILIPF